jgi:hypothetical protein
MSSGVFDKKLSTCFIKIVRKNIHRFAEFGVTLPSRIFKRSENESVQNGGEHFRKVLFLSKVKVMYYISIIS